MSKPQYFRVNRIRGSYMTMFVAEYKLGATYTHGNTVYKFIKSTSTGYNFLNVETNKCLLYRALYPIKDTAKWITKHTRTDIVSGKLMFAVPGKYDYTFMELNTTDL